MGTRYSIFEKLKFDPNCASCLMGEGIDTIVAGPEWFDSAPAAWKDRCKCGEVRHDHSQGHPHCTWVDEDPKGSEYEAKCEGFIPLDLSDLTAELQAIEENLR